MALGPAVDADACRGSKGMDSFKGRSFHTFHWPHEPVELAGKKVAVIGTGATAHPGDRRDRRQGRRADRVPAPAELERAAQQRPDLRRGDGRHPPRATTRSSRPARARPGGFEHEPDRRGFYEVTREERLALWDKLYDEPGFGIWLSNFREIFTDEKANAEFSDYIADRIRRRVKDPVVAEKLIPRDHGFGVQRVPMETRYFEAYNRDNVHLVDISETPIERVTETGLRTTERDYEFDIIVYATGFDAITGAFDQIDIQRRRRREAVRQMARRHRSTFLGMMVHGFPNLLMPAGPQSGSASTNYPRGIETGVNWCTDLLEHMWEPRLLTRRADGGGRGALDRPRHQDVRHDADAQGQVVVHRLQLQRARPRARQDPLPRLQRRHAEVRRRHQRGRGEGL